MKLTITETSRMDTFIFGRQV